MFATWKQVCFFERIAERAEKVLFTWWMGELERGLDLGTSAD